MITRLYLVFLAVVAVLVWASFALAHDHSRPGLNSWFPSLHSRAGSPCCDSSDFDTGSAKHLSDVDWESHDGHYRVRLEGQWVDVPDSAVIDGPNLDGRAMVWPYYINGSPIIRCFMPGTMS